MDLSFIWGVLVALVLVGIGLFALWGSLKKGYEDYMSSLADGTITDAEKIKLADDLLEAIENTKTAWTLMLKLAYMFKCKS